MKRFIFAYIAFVAYLPFHSCVRSNPAIDYRELKHFTLNYSVVLEVQRNKTEIGVYVFATHPNSTLRTFLSYDDDCKCGYKLYSVYPTKAISEIRTMVMQARATIPKTHHSTTTILLRVHSEETVPEKILKPFFREVKEVFKLTKFQVNPRAVSVLTEEDEGLMFWVSVNLLLGNLLKSSHKTVTILDFEGTNLQYAFVPNKSEEVMVKKKAKLIDLKFLGRDFNVFSYSDQGLGLYDMRRKVFEAEYVPAQKAYVSVCIHPKVTTTWTYKGVTYLLKGAPDDGTVPNKIGQVILNSTITMINIKKCKKEVKRVLSKYYYSMPLTNKTIYAVSGIRKGDQNRTFQTPMLKQLMKQFCVIPNVDRPFICIDLIYFAIVFKRVYSITPTQTINFAYNIDHMEVTWNVGAAFMNFQNQLKVFKSHKTWVK